MARFKTKTQITLEAVLDDPHATPGDKIKATELLEKYKGQRTNRRRHTKAKALLGLGAKQRVKELFPEGYHATGAIRCDDPDFRIVYAAEGTEIIPPATDEERAKAAPIKAKLEASHAREVELRKNETVLGTIKRWTKENAESAATPANSDSKN